MLKEIVRDVVKATVEMVVMTPICVGVTFLLLWGLAKADHMVEKKNTTTEES